MDNEKPILPKEVTFRTNEEGTVATISIIEEDHTLGNALRHVISQLPHVTVCGYTVPHPSESRVNMRVQTDGEITAKEAFKQGCAHLRDFSSHMESKFLEVILDYKLEHLEGNEDDIESEIRKDDVNEAMEEDS